MKALAHRALLPLLLAAQPALAQVPDNVAEASILTGWRGADGIHRAALAIDLKPGWKTYWRAAGEGGIPPVFDWSGSSNVNATEVRFPVPKVFDQNGMRSFGYESRVVFPILARPASNDSDIALSGEIDLGVCLDVCIPVTLKVSAVLPASGQRHQGEIQQALSDRPTKAKDAGLEDMTCEIAPIADGLRVTATTRLKKGHSPEAAVIEVANPSVWVSYTSLESEGDVMRVSADLVPPEAQPFFLARDAVRVTFLGGAAAIEFNGCR